MLCRTNHVTGAALARLVGKAADDAGWRPGQLAADQAGSASQLVSIGIAGMKALRDYRGRRDPHNYKLQASIEADADQLACAAGLVCGKLARTPACIIRGFAYQPGRGTAQDLIRSAATDLFR